MGFSFVSLCWLELYHTSLYVNTYIVLLLSNRSLYEYYSLNNNGWQPGCEMCTKLKFCTIMNFECFHESVKSLVSWQTKTYNQNITHFLRKIRIIYQEETPNLNVLFPHKPCSLFKSWHVYTVNCIFVKLLTSIQNEIFWYMRDGKMCIVMSATYQVYLLPFVFSGADY